MNYISSKETIDKLTADFLKIENNEFSYGTKYLDTSDNSEWLKLYLKSDYHGGGNPVLMKKEGINSNILIDTIFDSNDLMEISIASALLEYFEQINKQEFRLHLIERLEDHLNKKEVLKSKFEKKRIDAIILNSLIFDSTNRRDLLGKNDLEIKADHKFFREIADRAEKIKTVANKVYN